MSVLSSTLIFSYLPKVRSGGSVPQRSPSDPFHLVLNLMLGANLNSSCMASFELVLRSVYHVLFLLCDTVFLKGDGDYEELECICFLSTFSSNGPCLTSLMYRHF